ncbi:hypothetical protein [Enterococcus faecium]|uniref:hypothetical protein n=1 Tax=Enterococcus faecium TaxID=1352 RepID=UPI00338E13C8
MDNIDYFNQELQEYFNELLLGNKKIYEINQLSLEKMNDPQYARKYEDDFQTSNSWLRDRLRLYLTILPKRLEDQSFRNQREYCAFCSNVIHKELMPKLAHEVEEEGKNLYRLAVRYRNEIREKEGRY